MMVLARHQNLCSLTFKDVKSGKCLVKYVSFNDYLYIICK